MHENVMKRKKRKEQRKEGRKGKRKEKKLQAMVLAYENKNISSNFYLSLKNSFYIFTIALT